MPNPPLVFWLFKASRFQSTSHAGWAFASDAPTAPDFSHISGASAGPEVVRHSLRLQG